jgi:hypothetical protein
MRFAQFHLIRCTNLSSTLTSTGLGENETRSPSASILPAAFFAQHTKTKEPSAVGLIHATSGVCASSACQDRFLLGFDLVFGFFFLLSLTRPEQRDIKPDKKNILS